jgi:mono/diheme cytochrome c family protein
MRLEWRIGFAAVVWLGVAMRVAAAAPPELYTADQANSGQDVFAGNCAACHGPNLGGDEGPALTGPSFAPAANHMTIGGIFNFITTQMPQSAPGSLSHVQYEQVMAFLLSKNGYPAGTAALDYAETMKSTVLLVSTGP